MKNYYNQLTSVQRKEQLAKCRFMNSSEFNDGVNILKNKKIVIVGCGAILFGVFLATSNKIKKLEVKSHAN